MYEIYRCSRLLFILESELSLTVVQQILILKVCGLLTGKLASFFFSLQLLWWSSLFFSIELLVNKEANQHSLHSFLMMWFHFIILIYWMWSAADHSSLELSFWLGPPRGSLEALIEIRFRNVILGRATVLRNGQCTPSHSRSHLDGLTFCCLLSVDFSDLLGDICSLSLNSFFCFFSHMSISSKEWLIVTEQNE